MTDLIRDSREEETSGQEWLSIAQVALKLSVSSWQVRKWIDAGQFDEIAVFSERVKRISNASYRRFVEKGRKQSA